MKQAVKTLLLGQIQQTYRMFRAVKEMPDLDALLCEFCRRGFVTKRAEQIAFYQLTDKDYVRCRTMVAVSVCGQCLAETFDDTAADLIKDAVKRSASPLDGDGDTPALRQGPNGPSGPLTGIDRLSKVVPTWGSNLSGLPSPRWFVRLVKRRASTRNEIYVQKT
jgi:hypothetical protein